MAFGDKDTQALTLAREAGIRARGFEIAEGTHMFQTLVCPPNLDAENLHKILRDAIEACDRWAPSMTVCVEVESGSVVPDYVTEGVELLAADCYPASVIVVCDGATTHKPGPMLSSRLQTAVSSARPGGFMWHPIARQLV